MTDSNFAWPAGGAYPSAGPAQRGDGRPVLRAVGVGKVFGAVEVLKGVDFAAFPGEVHGLLGENGAGKSTLLKILQGVHQPDSGHLEVEGHPVTFPNVAASRAAGVSMIFQEFSLAPDLTVGQNVFLNRERRNAIGLIDDAASNRLTAEVLSQLEVELNPKSLVASLSTAQWQLVEIAKAVATNPRVLVMDEPTASLAEHEVSKLFQLIDRLRQRGIAIVYVSHRMNEIFQICDRITVLRDGRLVAQKLASETTLAETITDIVGREMSDTLSAAGRPAHTPGPVRLSVQDLSVAPLSHVNLEVHAGEVVGIAGLMGSGRTELLEAIFGLRSASSGILEVDGRVVALGSPRRAIDAGIAFVPEDRRRHGLILTASIRDNVALPIWGRLSRLGIIVGARTRELADRFIAQLAIRATSRDQEVRFLSGGNQQKVVLGKWLATKPRVLLLDEPTAGVDIGAKSEIVSIVREASDNGLAVLVVSSELPELLAISDRIVLIRNGAAEANLARSSIVDDEHLQRLIQLGSTSP